MGTLMALAADAYSPLRRLWDVQLNPAGGLCLVALIATSNHCRQFACVFHLCECPSSGSPRFHHTHSLEEVFNGPCNPWHVVHEDLPCVLFAFSAVLLSLLFVEAEGDVSGVHH